MKVLCCGSRLWVQRRPIHRELVKLPPRSIIIHGNAIGADAIANSVARALGFTVRAYSANWPAFGKIAGRLRNREMLVAEHTDAEPIDLVLAFAEDFSASKGTRDMTELAERVQIEVRRFSK